MNVRDSEHLIAQLRDKEGYVLTDQPQNADLILINTCSVREKPVSRLFSEIGIFAKTKQPHARIGVCGCTASHLGEEIIRRAPAVDFVLGARNTSKITDVLHRHHAVEVDIHYDETTYPFGDYRSNPYRAMVNITVGCDKSCTYCIVPHTRGDELSIPADLILREIRNACDRGAKEVILLGQNVNNYGRRFGGGAGADEPRSFTELLRRVSRIPGLERIRFQSPHPLHMDDAFLEEFATNPKICKQIHVPLQSGSDRILRAMKRGYTQARFLERCATIRARVPEATISTDVIVGFPGESEEDFEATMEVLEAVRFDQMFSFVYSPRPLTEAAQYADQIDRETAGERLRRRQARHNAILDASMQAQVGRVHSVYFDERKPDGRIAGRSDDGRLVFVAGGDELVGTIRDVRILSASRTALEGEPLEA